MVTRIVKVCNPYGIHVRPSAVIAKAAREFSSDLEVTSAKGETVEARNLLALISLGVTCGQEVVLRANGTDETAAVARLAELFQTRFDFERE